MHIHGERESGRMCVYIILIRNSDDDMNNNIRMVFQLLIHGLQFKEHIYVYILAQWLKAAILARDRCIYVRYMCIDVSIYNA